MQKIENSIEYCGATTTEVETYQLITVTFRLPAAPYLAIRCLKQLADDEGHQFPPASSVLQRHFYVNNALTGADTKDDALSLRVELTDIITLVGLNGHPTTRN